MKKTILALAIAALSTNAYTNDATGLGTNTTPSTLNAVFQANTSQSVNHALQNRVNESAVVNGIIYKDWAGTKKIGEVSVGTKDNEQTIPNVAAGETSLTSTEAVNGSQLYSVAYKVSENDYNIGLNKAMIDNHDALIENNSERLNTVEQLQTAHDVMIRDNTENIATLTQHADDNNVTNNQQWNKINSNVQTIANNTATINKNTQTIETNKTAINSNKQDIAINAKHINVNRINIDKFSNSIANTNKRLDGLSDDIHKHRKLASAGIASVAAVANIPHATYAGKSALGVGVGGHEGQQALAVRYSHLSDNTKWLVSASAGVDTQSQLTYGAGLTYQFH
ncbi:YadA C-terminal domain-containing protein [Aggregatibacter kilianii]|uniref:YadA C-terminal domain-containing protein n=1 Tax=Aggregatibacter kilianii TaxID=2025884 RepID=UPI0028D6CDDB|nr:YadA C-terminal domain-containing protein [Aggregatibacter kilianii]